MDGDILKMQATERKVVSERRHINYTVIVSVITLSLTFVGQLIVTIWFSGSFVATITEKQNFTNQRLDMIQSELRAMQGRWYTQDDAHRDIQRLDARDVELSSRMDRIERLHDLKKTF